MNSRQTNEWIKRALIDVADAEFAPYAAADHDAHYDWTPSATFEHTMNRLAAHHRRPRRYVNAAAKRVLLIAVAVLATISVAMAVTAVRDRSVQPVVHPPQDTHTDIVIDAGKAPNDEAHLIATYYTLTQVPEGFQKVEETDLDRIIWEVVWEDGQNGSILFDQRRPYGISMSIDTEKQRMQDILIGGKRGVYTVTSHGTEIWLWTDEEYCYELSFPQKYHDYFMQLANRNELLIEVKKVD